jgi:hypothetical protein
MKKGAIFATIFLSFSLLNCKEDISNSLEPHISANLLLENDNRVFDGDLVLGKKINNPYAMTNMKKASELLKNKGKNFSSLDLNSNYKYVRILPRNETEYDLINSDSTLDVFPYPLDFEISNMGGKYKDKALGDSKYTWLYTTIPSERVLNENLNVELLENLFLPFGNGKKDRYDVTLRNLEKSKLNLLMALEIEAQALTGYNKSSKKAKVKDWIPSGRVMVYDERMNMNGSFQYVPGPGFVPVHGCKVLARKNIFTVKTGFCNPQGYYSVDGSYNNTTTVDYSIKWDRGEFDIRDWTNSQAYTAGPSNSTASWNPSFTKYSTISNGTFSPEGYMNSHVHRGAHVYYYESMHGLTVRPPSNGFFSTRMHIAARMESCNNLLIPDVWECRPHYFNFNSAKGASDVVLPFDLFNSNQYKIAHGSNIFATIIHELAHAVHFKLGMTNLTYVSNIGQAQRLAESWAQFVGWHLLTAYYPNVFNDYGESATLLPLRNHEDYQRRFLSQIQGSSYTPVFIDLVDNFNQNSWFAPSNDGVYYFENIYGFTPAQIETAIIVQPTNWYSVRNFISANFNQSQSAAVQQIFSDYD